MNESPLSIDAVMAAMANYAAASNAESEARESYDGYSWDYHGSYYIDAVSNARDAAKRALDDYIRRCVADALADEAARVRK